MTFELSFDCDGASYRVSVEKFEKHCVAWFHRDGKFLECVHYSHFPWDTPKAIMANIIGVYRRNACSELRRVFEGMLGELHRITTLEVA